MTFSEESIEEPVYAGTFTPSGLREHFDSVGFFELEEDCWREIGLGYTAEVIDFLDTGMAFDEEYEQSRFEELQIWLEENVVHFSDPKELTLFDFEVHAILPRVVILSFSRPYINRFTRF